MALQRDGYEVSVICPKGSEQARKSFEIIQGIKVYRYPMGYQASGGLGYLFEYMWGFVCAVFLSLVVLLRDGFDIIHSANPPDMFFLLAWPYKLLGKKFVYDQHDICPELFESKFGKRGWFYKLLLWFEKKSYRSADLVIVTNQSYKDIAKDRGGVTEERLAIVRNGVDSEYFRRVAPRPELKDGFAYMALYLGVMGKQDGVDRVVQAAEHVAHTYGRKDVLFVMVGRGECWEKLQDLARALQVQDAMRFVGRISDELLLEYLSTADVCLAPDPPDRMNQLSTMTKIVEYMALQQPIVSFDLLESRRSAGDAAVYIEREDPKLFAEAIIELLNDPAKRQKMGEIGVERTQSLIGWNRSRYALLEAYSRISGKLPPAAVVTGSKIAGELRLFEDSTSTVAENYLSQYYRGADGYLKVAAVGPLSQRKGFFRFGSEVICYGQCLGEPADSPSTMLYDASQATEFRTETIILPFELTEVVDNLREERYREEGEGEFSGKSLLNRFYYFLRPILPIEIRKHLQKMRLNGWRQLNFPHWPVDRSVDNLFEQLLVGSIQASQAQSIPFIWFWPDDASSCAIMTHDVESKSGRDFCSTLMDINDSFGVPASFQIVPESRYPVSAAFLKSIRERGFVVNVQDLNHDGRLFQSQREFLERAAKINAYAQEYGAEGFRAAILYRNERWFEALKFSYDMSVPNVAHLDPQRGGCCTVMPYFIGDILELPVTMTQDYSLFHILGDYSIDLWKDQIRLIMEKHGLMSFIVHPDYVIGHRERRVYETLLAYLVTLRNEQNVWIATSSEVNLWWRQRNAMKLISAGNGWNIHGEGSQRARIAYATETDGKLTYSFGPRQNGAQRTVEIRKK